MRKDSVHSTLMDDIYMVEDTCAAHVEICRVCVACWQVFRPWIWFSLLLLSSHRTRLALRDGVVSAVGSGGGAFGQNTKPSPLGGSSGGWGQQQARTPGAFGKQSAFGGGGAFGGNRLSQNQQARCDLCWLPIVCCLGVGK